LGIVFGVRPRIRLWIGGLVTAVLYTAQEIVPPFARFALAILRTVGPFLGIHRRFQLTADWTDLFCLVLIPLAVAYGARRLGARIGVSDRPGRRARGKIASSYLPKWSL